MWMKNLKKIKTKYINLIMKKWLVIPTEGG